MQAQKDGSEVSKQNTYTLWVQNLQNMDYKTRTGENCGRNMLNTLTIINELVKRYSMCNIQTKI